MRQNYTVFLARRSDPATDPTWPKSTGSDRIRESNEIWTSAMAETKYTERPVIYSLKPKSEDLPNFWQENTAFM